MVNKEFGSDFDYMFDPALDKAEIFPSNTEFFFSGRVALYNLLRYGIDEYGWQKVGFPSYYCHEVVDFCRALSIKIEYYEYNPILEKTCINWDDKQGSVLINVDFFGVKKLDCSFLKNTVVIDDLTHNLLGLNNSNADYCIASLRKQLPLAVGGICVGLNGDFLSENSDNKVFANCIAIQRLSAMLLKKKYLTEGSINKDIFRTLFIESEEKFSSLRTNAKLPSIIYSQLKEIDPLDLITKTRNNITLARGLIRLSHNATLLKSHGQTEMGLVILCADNDMRDKLKYYLIRNKIFPAILWPGQIYKKDIDLQKRILFVHADFRYDRNDISFIVKKINMYFSNV